MQLFHLFFSRKIYVFALIVLTSLVLPSHGQPTVGDVNLDGHVDGRDAFLALRAAHGLDSLSTEAMQQADAYPAGQPDGQVTVEDARHILRYLVGILTEGDLGGSYASKPPRIELVEPLVGRVGEEILIQGEHFVESSPRENVVRMGNVIAPVVKVTGTALRITIPEGAVSGKIEVWTPGGRVLSPNAFTVVERIDGQLEVEGESSARYTVIAAADARQNLDGREAFDLQVDTSEVSLIGAVPDNPDRAPYMALHLPGGPGASVTVNARSTAETLLFLHPFLVTDNPAAVSLILELMQTLPEVETLVAVIEERYPQGAKGLEDSQVLAAWQAAIEAILDNLGDSMAIPMAKTEGKYPRKGSGYAPSAKHRSQSLLIEPKASDQLPVLLRTVDADYIQVDMDASWGSYAKPGYPEESNYSPLDWYITFHRLDPEDMKIGLVNPYQTSQESYRRIGGGKSTFIPASQWAANIDLIGSAINFTFDASTGWLDLNSTGFPYNSLKEGVYVIRAYSGSLTDRDRDDNIALRAIPDGFDNANRALAMNLGIALLDVMSLVGGGDSNSGFLRNALRQASIKAGAALTQESTRLYPASNPDYAVNAILRTLVEMGKGVTETMREWGIEAAKIRMAESMVESFKAATGVLGALSKISTVGKIGERIAGVMGYLINPLGLEIAPAGPTPLETFYIVVGDPFKPKVTGIEPTTGSPGDHVVLTGERLMSRKDLTVVKFGDYHARIVEFTSPERIVVEVPLFAEPFHEYDVTLDTSSTSNEVYAPEFFYIDWKPTIDVVTPTGGYVPTKNPDNPFYQQEEPIVEIHGRHLIPPSGSTPYGVYFENDQTVKQAEVVERSEKTLKVRAPEDISGSVSVFVRDYDRERDSNKGVFVVFGAPVIESINPPSAM
ncbi:hypothetical protein GF373_11360, partial [bacterium]|nr:hypothetical protein [bacterium]